MSILILFDLIKQCFYVYVFECFVLAELCKLVVKAVRKLAYMQILAQYICFHTLRVNLKHIIVVGSGTRMIRMEKFFAHTDELKSAKRKSDKSGTSSSFLTQRTMCAANFTDGH